MSSEKVGGAPHNVVLEFIGLTVGKHHLPHHLHHAPAAPLVEGAIDQMGEVIKVDRLVLGRRRLVDQFIGARIVERKAALDHGAQGVALALRHVAVDGGRVHQQSCRRQTIVVVSELAWMLAAVDELGDEVAK